MARKAGTKAMYVFGGERPHDARYTFTYLTSDKHHALAACQAYSADYATTYVVRKFVDVACKAGCFWYDKDRKSVV